MKTKFKVGEFPHVVLNGLAPNGATAGENARYVDGRLMHNGNVTAAAFITDATHADGRPVVIIAPQYQSNDARWNPSTLAAAVPPSHARVELQTWPEYHQGWSEARRFTEAADSAVALFPLYRMAVERDCLASIHSAEDTEGEKPTRLASYAMAIRDLLSLKWSDAVAQFQARQEWEAMRDKWQLSDTGDYALPLVRAIAQRAKITAAASEYLPMLRSYFTERAAVRTLAERMRLTESASRSMLETAMAAVFRAGIPESEKFPVNMLAVVASDFDKVNRANSTRQAWRALPQAWRRAVMGDPNAAGRYTSANIPARLQAQFRTAYEFAHKVATRDNRKKKIADFARDLATLNMARDAMADAENVTDNAAMIETAADVIKACRNVESGARNIVSVARDIESFAPRHPILASHAVRFWMDEETRAQMRARAEALRLRFADAAKAAERETNAADYRARLAENVLSVIATTPRAAISRAQQMGYDLLAYYGGREKYGAAYDALQSETESAADAAREACATVSPVDEWRNGGAAPGDGDWARVKGSKTVTTRNVTVSTRAVRAAMDWLAAQPEGAAHAPAGTKIDGYSFAGRDADGTVRVGCHTFTAAAVADIREQLSHE